MIYLKDITYIDKIRDKVGQKFKFLCKPIGRGRVNYKCTLSSFELLMLYIGLDKQNNWP